MGRSSSQLRAATRACFHRLVSVVLKECLLVLVVFGKPGLLLVVLQPLLGLCQLKRDISNVFFDLGVGGGKFTLQLLVLGLEPLHPLGLTLRFFEVRNLVLHLRNLRRNFLNFTLLALNRAL